MNLKKKTFELPSPEIWVINPTIVENLAKVLNTDIGNFKELIGELHE